MIDNIENAVFDMIEKSVHAKFPEAELGDQTVRKAAAFPFVSVQVVDRRIDTDHMYGKTPQYEIYTFMVDVYSNKTTGRKKEAKDIIYAIDEVLLTNNFIRTKMQPIEDINNASIFRLSADYTVVTDGETLYRRS